MKTLHNYHQVWKQYGFTPEFYNIPKGEAQSNRDGYPLRPGKILFGLRNVFVNTFNLFVAVFVIFFKPSLHFTELIESVMYLYRATKDPYLLEVGVDIVESIDHSCRTRCGYATVSNFK